MEWMLVSKSKKIVLNKLVTLCDMFRTMKALAANQIINMDLR